MLVLSRRSGETIAIGEGIRVRVLEIQGNRVRLGVEAPGDTRILRDELCFWRESDLQGEPAPLLPDLTANS